MPGLAAAWLVIGWRGRAWLGARKRNRVPLHPAGERVISSKACGLETDEAGLCPVAELYGPHVRLPECLLPALGANPARAIPGQELD